MTSSVAGLAAGSKLQALSLLIHYCIAGPKQKLSELPSARAESTMLLKSLRPYPQFERFCTRLVLALRLGSRKIQCLPPSFSPCLRLWEFSFGVLLPCVRTPPHCQHAHIPRRRSLAHSEPKPCIPRHSGRSQLTSPAFFPSQFPKPARVPPVHLLWALHPLRFQCHRDVASPPKPITRHREKAGSLRD